MFTLTMTVMLTTIVYHATHNTWVRALDVSTLWIIGFTGLAQCINGIVMKGVNIYFVIVLIIIVIVNIINIIPACHEKPGLIKLHWHVTIHLLASVSLSLLTLGWNYTA